MSEFVPLAFPAWIVWRVRRGAALPQPEGRGPNGRKLCRWCAKECRPFGHAWCSNECQSSFHRVFTWEAVAEYVFARDGGCCVRCGCDHPGWRHTEARTPGRYRYDWRGADETSEGARCLLVEHPWQCDHIRPVKDGGTDDPDNLRTLCFRCHIAVGYEQRAARKQPAPQLELSA